MVIQRLQRIGEGRWEQDNGTQQRLAHIRYHSSLSLPILACCLMICYSTFDSLLKMKFCMLPSALQYFWLCRDLEVYRTLLTKGGRIVFEVAVDYSQTAHVWKDMIRLWVCLSA